MGVCETGILCCPDWVVTLAVLGGVIIYALIGALIFVIVKAIKEDLEWDYVVVFIFLWPLIIVGAIAGAFLYYIARLIAMPIIGADKYDLKDLERKMESKIDRGDDKIKDYLEYYKPSRKKPTKSVKGKAKKKAKK